VAGLSNRLRGVIVAFIGLFLIIKPTRRSGLRTRRRGAIVAALGLLITATGFLLPAGESRVARSTSRLDEFMPAWQFNELHAIRIVAPPERRVCANDASSRRKFALYWRVIDPGSAIIRRMWLRAIERRGTN